MAYFRRLTRSAMVVVSVGVAFGACGGDDESSGSAGSAGSAGVGGGASGAAGVGASGSGGGGGTDASAGAGGATNPFDCSPASGAFPNLKLTELLAGFDRPLIAASPPGDDQRLFVGEQAGVLHVYKNGQLLPTPFLDISGRVNDAGNEQGLLGLAFHPSYAQNGRFYVHYTGKTPLSGDTVVSEFTRSTSDPDQADPSSEKLVLTVDQPESNHNGGSIEFRNGLLFLGLGDGGGGGDQHGTIGNGQSLSTLLGKILRIDPDAPAGGKQYGIPSGNMSGAGVLPEIWSYGLRNPYRFSFDACTGDLYMADVGQNKIEEIDVEPAGAASGLNYGWRVMEGSQCFNPATGCDTSGKVLPAAEYDHTKGCSVTGGYVYRGSAIPGLRGYYLYADFCSGNFWRFRWDGAQAQELSEITGEINPGGIGAISSFGQDAKGELYVTSFSGGKLFRIDAE
jgi:glucose/arabinose dehydrogenase